MTIDNYLINRLAILAEQAKKLKYCPRKPLEVEDLKAGEVYTILRKGSYLLIFRCSKDGFIEYNELYSVGKHATHIPLGEKSTKVIIMKKTCVLMSAAEEDIELLNERVEAKREKTLLEDRARIRRVELKEEIRNDSKTPSTKYI